MKRRITAEESLNEDDFYCLLIIAQKAKFMTYLSWNSNKVDRKTFFNFLPTGLKDRIAFPKYSFR